MSSRGRSAGRSSAARAGRPGGARGRPQTGHRDDGTRRRDDASRREAGAAGADTGGSRPRGPRLDPTARRDRVRAVVEPVVSTAGYDLEDVTLSRAGRRHLVRVVIDRDGGVTLDGVAEVSRAVSAALDEAEQRSGELFSGEYALEVGSPGVDRPLTLPRHWRRNVGRLVKVQVAPDAEGGGGQLTGRVLAADDSAVTLDVAGAPREVAYHRLGPGRVQVEFSRLADLDDTDLDDGADVNDDADLDDGDPDDPDSAELGADELDDEDLEEER